MSQYRQCVTQPPSATLQGVGVDQRLFAAKVSLLVIDSQALKCHLMPLPDIRNICVVLVSTRNPLNIGAAARAMSNFGIRNLRLVNPYEPGFREARSAVGAAATLQDARIFSTLAEAIADCVLVIGTTGGRDRNLDNTLRRLQDAAPLVEQEAARGMVAVVFGSEKRGLSNDDLSYCHWTMNIPTAEDHVSMNLGQAVAVSLYEITRVPASTELAPSPESPALTIGDSLATSAESERLAASLLQALGLSGYVKPGTDAAVEDRVRRLVRRMRLTSGDADLVQGMVKQILWKLQKENG
jgi:TrmH family RNA methyltransferase